ncbi:MAG: prenyltransferase [Kiritimatiellota bacterium]|nr:prenyltransferase [Kiritimatiellota bacterium]
MMITKSLLQVWITAVRPFAYTASALAVVLGLAIANYSGYPIRWGAFVVTLLGVLCFHTGANLLNDCFDHRRGLDTQVIPTSGAVARGWITEAQAFRTALALLGAGVICGMFLTWYAGWVVLLLGVLGTLFSIGYTTPRWCFKYIGLGDVAIFFSFGILVVFGAFWVQARQFHWLPVLWSVPPVLLTVGILHANNWRDIESDPSKGCRTVANMLGSRGSESYYRMLVIGPFVLIALYLLLNLFPGLGIHTPLTTLAAFFALPLALRLARIKQRGTPEQFMMLDGSTAQLHMVFTVLCSAAFFGARYLPGIP